MTWKKVLATISILPFVVAVFSIACDDQSTSPAGREVTDDPDTTPSVAPEVTISPTSISVLTADLVIDAPTADEGSTMVGESFTLNLTIRNQGIGPADASTLTLYRSTDPSISSDDVEEATVELDAIASSESSQASVTLTAPSTPGTYHYGACVAPVSHESGTTNNCSEAVAVIVLRHTPDLVVDAPTEEEDSPMAGQTFTLNLTIRNQGTGPADASSLTLYRSTDPSISSDDVEEATVELDAIASSESSQASVTLTAPSTPGTYHYGACVAPVSHESDTTNNCSEAVAVIVLPHPPDLVIDAPTAEGDSPMVGQSFTLSLTVRNQGTGPADASSLTLYRSTDPSIASDDAEEGMVELDGLAPLESSQASVTLTAPSTPGTYHYGACVDSVPHESGTTNNCSEAVAVIVLPHPPDLVIDAPTAEGDSPMVGQSFTLSLTVRNQGTGPADASSLTLYRSTDPSIASDDAEEGMVELDGLAPLESSQASVTLTAPSTPGTYHYGACVDSVPHESGTTNNCSEAVAVIVLPHPPDLVIDAPTAEGDSPMVGQSFTLSLTVRNQGPGPAAASSLTLYRSTDPSISSDDVEEATVELDAIASSESSQASVTLTAPSTPGTYLYGACVDSVPHESGTTNNCSEAVAVIVLPLPPDLVVDAPTAEEDSPMVGQSFTLSLTVRNQGIGPAAASSLTLYRSTDPSISSDDVDEATVELDAIAPSESSQASVTLTAPSTPGTYLYGACVDSVPHESDTTNNCSEVIAVTVLEFNLERLSWIRDGTSSDEEEVVRLLRSIDKKNPSIAQQVSGLPWMTDGIASVDLSIVRHIRDLVFNQPELALPVTSVRERTGHLIESVLTSLRTLRAGDSSLHRQLTRQQWFRDGLTNEEAALIVALRSAVADKGVFQDLLEGEHVRSANAVLPLAGEVNLFAVGRKVHELETTLEVMIRSVELLEEYMATSWPSPNVIALVETQSDLSGDFAGRYEDDHIVLKHPSRKVTSHELAHYYFDYNHAPVWLSEGAADHLSFYIMRLTEAWPSTSVSYLNDRKQLAERCAPHGISNVQMWIRFNEKDPSNCRYLVGRLYLGGMHRVLGNQVVSTALRDLHDEGRVSGPVSEDEIFNAFLTNSPTDQRDIFRHWYRCLHGRPIPGYFAPRVSASSGGIRNALVSLYNATNGPDWKNSENWLTKVPLDQWHGVDVDCDGSIIKLDLSENGLKGHIPPEIGSLANAIILDLSWNQLTGPIPTELGRLSNLVELKLTGNHLTGELPVEVSKLSRLRSLNLTANQISGPVPPELSELSELVDLLVGGNQLTGPIPPELSELSNLRSLNIENNQLTGPIPPELSELSNLEGLILDENRLTGPIPPELSILSNLRSLSIENNQLTGPIPPELGELSNLQGLILGGNQLTGPIPLELSKLSILRILILRGNQLTGPILPELGHLSDLVWLVLGNNQLTGPIPKELGKLSDLVWLDLKANRLSGPIHPDLGKLAVLIDLTLDENQLTGRIPVELGKLGDTLAYLALSGNQLSGCIPQGLASVENSDIDSLGLQVCGDP